MIEGNRIKFVKGIQKVNFSPEEELNSFFIIREFNDNLNIMCRYILDPQMNICFYNNQFCFLINGQSGENLTLDLSKFLTKKNLEIVPCNSTSKNIKEFIDGNGINIIKGNEKIKKSRSETIKIFIRDFDNYINISTSVISPEINIILYNGRLVLSLGSGEYNFTIDLSGFLENNNLKIICKNDIKVPEITDKC